MHFAGGIKSSTYKKRMSIFKIDKLILYLPSSKAGELVLLRIRFELNYPVNGK
jgi:hypothetical protein